MKELQQIDKKKLSGHSTEKIVFLKMSSSLTILNVSII